MTLFDFAHLCCLYTKPQPVQKMQAGKTQSELTRMSSIRFAKSVSKNRSYARWDAIPLDINPRP